MSERDEVLAGLLDGASHAKCESCRSVMKRAYRLLAEAPMHWFPSGDVCRAQVEAAAKLHVSIDTDAHLARCLEVDAVDLLVTDNDVRLWRLYELEDRPGQWRHAPSGTSGTLAEMLRGIACTYLDRAATQEATSNG